MWTEKHGVKRDRKGDRNGKIRVDSTLELV